MKGLGRCGQPCMTHASPAVDGAAPAPPTCHSGVQGRGGRCRGGRQIGPRLGTRSVLARMTKNYHDCRFSRRLLCPRKISIRGGGKNVFNSACDKSCHGFTHVDSHIEELQIKVDLSPSPPSPFPSTSGLEQGAPFAVSSVSDLVKLDIHVTKASPHNRKEFHYLFLAPSPSLERGPSAISSIIHTGTDVHNADLFLKFG